MGAKIPYVVRKAPDEDDGPYQIVGECYVHGMMDGEVLGRGLKLKASTLYSRIMQ